MHALSSLGSGLLLTAICTGESLCQNLPDDLANYVILRAERKMKTQQRRLDQAWPFSPLAALAIVSDQVIVYIYTHGTYVSAPYAR